MLRNHQQEEFSRAFVHTLISVAGFKLVPPALPDDDSVDFSIASRGPMGSVRSPRIDVQLKSCSNPSSDEPWIYPLKIKNYDDLRHEDYQAPRILVVVFVPQDTAAWLHESPDQMVLRHCACWLSLRGSPPTDNTTSVTVSIPGQNRLSVASLRAMMDRVGNGGSP